MANSSINVRPVGKFILVDIYDDGNRAITLGGKKFFLLDDSTFGKGKQFSSETEHPGIRDRWALVLATCDYAEKCGIHVGDKVYLERLEWSRGVVYDKKTGKKMWRIDTDKVLGIDSEGLTAGEKKYIEGRYERNTESIMYLDEEDFDE